VIVVGLPLNRLLIPPAPPPQRSKIEGEASPEPRWAMPILAFVFAAIGFVSGAMAAHLPRLLEMAGASATIAIATSALVGPAQVGAPLIEFGALRMVHPLVSARLATILHPLGAGALALFGPGAVFVFAVRAAPRPSCLWDLCHWQRADAVGEHPAAVALVRPR
jgi:hypothetical protein